MGCQSSKSAKAAVETPTPVSPSKTLLEGAEGKKSPETVALHGEGAASSPPTSQVEPQRVPLSTSGVHSVVSTHTGNDKMPMSAAANSNAPSDAVRSHVSRTQRTFCTSNKEIDVMVVGFASHDSTVGSVLGRNSKQMQWKVMYDREASPIDIKLNVQEHKLHSNEVRIESDGESIFQGAGPHAKAKMTEDFHYQWSFRGAIQGINEPNYFEVHPAHLSNFAGESWFPATITGQREDGHFEVLAQELDTNGCIIEVKYAAVHKDNLREAASKKPLAVPEDSLMLDVPKQDPLRAVLSMANGEHVTHHFGRPSPPPTAVLKNPEIAFKVSKDRSEVTANVGHRVLAHFVSGEVQAKVCEADKLKHSWTFMLGPFAEHKVEIVKRHTMGKVVTLLVDGEVLVESTGADIGCQGHEWQCKFRFVGERVLDFEVHKTNSEGAPLEATGSVKERRKYVHECFVTIPNEWDFSSARLFLDGTHFAELPMESERHEEENLTMSPMSLMQSYSISTPYMVDKDAPSSVMMFANELLVKATDTKSTAGGFFARWCDCSSVVQNEGGASRIV